MLVQAIVCLCKLLELSIVLWFILFMSLLQSLTPQEQTQALLKHKQLFNQKFPRFDGLTDEEKAQFIIDHQEEGEKLFVTAIQQTNPYVKIHTTQRTDSELVGATGRISTFRTDSGATITTVTRLDSDRYNKGAELAYSGRSIFELSRQDCEDIDYYNENRPGAAKQARTKGSTDAMATASCGRADASSSPSLARRKGRELPNVELPKQDSTQTTTAPMSSMERRLANSRKLPGQCR